MSNDKHDTLYIGKFYLVGGGDLGAAESHKKIGVTGKGAADLLDRTHALSRTKSPIKWIPLKAWKFDIDALELEQAIHGLLEDKRIEGEWFDDSAETIIPAVTRLVKLFGGVELELNNLDTDKTNVDVRDTVKAKIENNEIAFKLFEKHFAGLGKIRNRSTDNPANWVTLDTEVSRERVSVTCNKDSWAIKFGKVIKDGERSFEEMDEFCLRFGYTAELKKTNKSIVVKSAEALDKILSEVTTYPL